MTPWSVVEEDNQENPPRMRYFRYAVFSLAALLVLSLGLAFFPAEPPAPAEPPFSEQARAAALEEALELRTTGLDLAASGSNGATGVPVDNALDQVVTLLTFQARALLLPGSPASTGPGPAYASTSSAGVLPSPTPPSSSARPAVTVAEFAASLAGSGRQRLRDAETADGGMARLLAGAGTAQLLAAERLGARGAPQEEPVTPLPEASAEPRASSGTTAAPSAGPQATAPACPATPSAATSGSTTPPAGGVTLGAALVAAAGAELEAVYGYQAALTRLPAEAAGPASAFLAQHRELAAQAGAHALLQCAALPPQAPGYVLDQEFLDAPAAGLARLEVDTLPLYGDVVALSGRTTRVWALSALQGSARRAQHWGAAADPLPGLVLDEGQLPQLPQ
ncbi:MAG: DUF4439 domain-containing protein [Arthrobacter sp.]